MRLLVTRGHVLVLLLYICVYIYIAISVVGAYLWGLPAENLRLGPRNAIAIHVRRTKIWGSFFVGRYPWDVLAILVVEDFWHLAGLACTTAVENSLAGI